MGEFFAKAFDKISSKKEKRVIIVGLDAAGKTTIMYKLKMPSDLYTYPSCGMSMYIETGQYKGFDFTAWDSGYQTKMDPLFRHYYPGTDGIIYVVDSNDRERICDSYCHPDKVETLTFGYIRQYLQETKRDALSNDATHSIPQPLYHIISQYAQNEYYTDVTAQSELHKLLKEPLLEGVPLLVFANKMDLPNALNLDEVTDCLKLNKICQKDRSWHIQSSCAMTGDGLHEGLYWLMETMVNNKKK
eukprot:172049_1